MAPRRKAGRLTTLCNVFDKRMPVGIGVGRGRGFGEKSLLLESAFFEDTLTSEKPL